MAKEPANKRLYQQLQKDEVPGIERVASQEQFDKLIKESPQFYQNIQDLYPGSPDLQIPYEEFVGKMFSSGMDRSYRTSPDASITDLPDSKILEDRKEDQMDRVVRDETDIERIEAKRGLQSGEAGGSVKYNDVLARRAVAQRTGDKETRKLERLLAMKEEGPDLSQTDFFMSLRQADRDIGGKPLNQEDIFLNKDELQSKLDRRLNLLDNYSAVQNTYKQAQARAKKQGWDSVMEMYQSQGHSLSEFERFLNADPDKLSQASKLLFNHETDGETEFTLPQSIRDNMPGATDQQRLQVYANLILDEHNKLSAQVDRVVRQVTDGTGRSYPSATSTNSFPEQLADGIAARLFGESLEYKRWIETSQQLMALAPMLSKGVDPGSVARDKAFLENFNDAFAGMFFREADNLSNAGKQELSAAARRALAGAGVNLDPNSEQAIKDGLKQGTSEKVAQMLGTTSGIMASMAVPTPAAGKVTKGMKLFTQIQSKSKLGKWGLKVADEAIKAGINYQAASVTAVDRADEELNFGSGAAGSIGSNFATALLTPAMKTFAKPVLSFLYGRVGAGIGETAEETVQEFYQRYQKTESFQKAYQSFKDDVLSDATEAQFFFFGSFLMGMGMSAISPSEFALEMEELRQNAAHNMSEEELRKVSAIIDEFSDVSQQEDTQAPAQEQQAQEEVSTEEAPISENMGEQEAEVSPGQETEVEAEVGQDQVEASGEEVEVGAETQTQTEDTAEQEPEQDQSQQPDEYQVAREKGEERSGFRMNMRVEYDEEGNPLRAVRQMGTDEKPVEFQYYEQDGDVYEIRGEGAEPKKLPPKANAARLFKKRKSASQKDKANKVLESNGLTFDGQTVSAPEISDPAKKRERLTKAIDDLDKLRKSGDQDVSVIEGALVDEIEKLDKQLKVQDAEVEGDPEIQIDVSEDKSSRIKGYDTVKGVELRQTLGDADFEVVKADLEAGQISDRGIKIREESQGFRKAKATGNPIALAYRRLSNPKLDEEKKQKVDAAASRAETRKASHNRISTSLAEKTEGNSGVFDQVKEAIAGDEKVSTLLSASNSVDGSIRRKFNRKIEGMSGRITPDKAIQALEALIYEDPATGDLYSKLTDQIQQKLTDEDADTFGAESTEQLAKNIASQIMFSKYLRDNNRFSVLGQNITSRKRTEKGFNSQWNVPHAAQDLHAQYNQSVSNFAEDMDGYADQMQFAPKKGALATMQWASDKKKDGKPERLSDWIDVSTDGVSRKPSERISRVNEVLKRIERKFRKLGGSVIPFRLLMVKPKAGSPASYNRQFSGIRLRHKTSYRLFSHELGHHIDNAFNIVGQDIDYADPMTGELLWLSSYGSAAPTSDPDMVYERREGWAVFIEAYLINPTEAMSLFPATAAVFESNVSDDVKSILADLSLEYRLYLSSKAWEQAVAHISDVLGRDLNAEESNMIQHMMGWKAKANAVMFDAMAPTKWIYEEALRRRDKHVGILLPKSDPRAVNPKEDFRILSRRLLGFSAAHDHMMRDGIRRANGTLALHNGEPMTLEWLLAPFTKVDAATMINEMDTATSYMVAKRVVDLIDREEAKKTAADDAVEADPDNNKPYKVKYTREEVIAGIGGGIVTDYETAQQIIHEIEVELRANNAAKHDRIQEADKRYKAYAGELLRYWLDAGRIGIVEYNRIVESGDQYVAMQRIMSVMPEVEEEQTGGAGSVLASTSMGSTRDIIKGLTGSSRTIQNPYVSLASNAYKMMREADRNRATRALITTLIPKEDDSIELKGILAGTVQEVTTEEAMIDPSVKGMNAGAPEAISVFFDGVKKFYVVHPQIKKDLDEMYKFIGRIDGAFKWLQKSAQLLRVTITKSPPFMFRNSVRDNLHRIFGGSYNSDFNPLDYIQTKEDWANYRALGGAQSGFYSYDRKSYYLSMEDTINQLIADKDSRILNVSKLMSPKNMLKRVWEKYNRFADMTEDISRVAEYKAAFRRAKKLGYNDEEARNYAAFEARNILDFAVVGTFIRQLRPYVPFLNATVQAMNRLGQSILKDSARSKEDFGTSVPVRFLMKYLLLGGISIAMRMLVRQFGGEDAEKRYQKLPAYKRDLYWNFPIGDKLLAIPKPFEMGIFATSLERAASHYFLKEENAFQGHARLAMEKMFFPMEFWNIAKDGLGGVRGLGNYDSFRQRFIIPPWEHGIDLSDRNTLGASYFSRLIETKDFNVWIQDATNGEIQIDPRNIDNVIKNQLGYVGAFILKASNTMGSWKDDPEQKPYDRFYTPMDFFQFMAGTGSPYSASSTTDVLWLKSKIAMHKNKLRSDRKFGDDVGRLNEALHRYYHSPTQQRKERGDEVINLAEKMRKRWEDEGFDERMIEKRKD